METNKRTHVRAVHHHGVLELLDPLELPEGAQVQVIIQSISPDVSNIRLAHPTRLVPAKDLDRLTALVQVGGDALADSEALYDADCHCFDRPVLSLP